MRYLGTTNAKYLDVSLIAPFLSIALTSEELLFFGGQSSVKPSYGGEEEGRDSKMSPECKRFCDKGL